MPKDIWPQVQVPGITFGIQSLNSTVKRFQNMWNRGQKLEVLSARPLSSHPHLILPQQKRPTSSYSGNALDNICCWKTHLWVTVYRESWLIFVLALPGTEEGSKSCQRGKMTISQSTYVTYGPLRMQCSGIIWVRPKDTLEITVIIHSSRASL